MTAIGVDRSFIFMYPARKSTIKRPFEYLPVATSLMKSLPYGGSLDGEVSGSMAARLPVSRMESPNTYSAGGDFAAST